MKLKGVIFDMDGTVVDAPYDWKKIKDELRTEGRPILVHIKSLEEPEKSAKWKILEGYEKHATQKAVLKEGMKEFLLYLKERRLKIALVTNNSRINVDFLMDKFDLNFDYVLSRERGLWKPSGAPFLAVLEELNLQRNECCVIGDTRFDIEAAREVQIRKIYILNADKDKFSSNDVKVFSTVRELREHVESLL
ncbi:HAD family hydrolase [Acidobacteriota bacterium]